MGNKTPILNILYALFPLHYERYIEPFGGFAPNSSAAELLSKALGTRTVMSGSVSRGRNDPSQSLQMIERPLLTADELKSLPKGDFIVMKTGTHPMRTHLKLFFEWGISFDERKPYAVPERSNRRVEYADRQELLRAILKKYPTKARKTPPVDPNAPLLDAQAVTLLTAALGEATAPAAQNTTAEKITPSHKPILKPTASQHPSHAPEIHTPKGDTTPMQNSTHTKLKPLHRIAAEQEGSPNEQP